MRAMTSSRPAPPRPGSALWARFGALAALAAVLGAAGCGGSGVPMQRTYKTTGRILLDGKPAEGVDVRFLPKDPTNFKMSETPLGHTGPDGTFVLTTYYTGDGAPAGEYMVAVAKPDQIPVPDEADELAQAKASAKAIKERKGKPGFPPVYQVPQKSGLTAIVPARDSELPPFELSSAQK